ncbi:hypothetical protein AB3R30_18260 [Leptolyngbyaceae cyanobacterium UHCC 1019]
MSNKTQWIKEVSQEINRSQASLKQAIKDTGRTVNSKYDVVICYVEWYIPKPKNVEQQEASYQRRIKYLIDLLHDFSLTSENLKNDFNDQMERKSQLIDTQNQIIAEQARIIAEMGELLRGLPPASGE